MSVIISKKNCKNVTVLNVKKKLKYIVKVCKELSVFSYDEEAKLLPKLLAEKTHEQRVKFSQTNHTSNNSARKKIKVIYIAGYGCESIGDANNTKYEKWFKWHINQYFKAIGDFDTFEYMCNENKLSIAYDIFKTYCMLPPTKSDFINSILEKIRHYIKAKSHVILLGHSYGGLIASMVAQVLSRDNLEIIRDNLTIITFGSIFVPSNEETNNINITHFMYKNDLALQCNHVKENDERVIWLDKVNPNNSGKTSHNSYIANLSNILDK
jgi:hypothetical protein